MDLFAGVTPQITTPADPICPSPKQVMSKFLGDKVEEWAAVTRRSPLNLLDLPVDILKEIVREVRDMSGASKILCCSPLF